VAAMEYVVAMTSSKDPVSVLDELEGGRGVGTCDVCALNCVSFRSALSWPIMGCG
jgi:hypothetical protein